MPWRGSRRYSRGAVAAQRGSQIGGPHFRRIITYGSGRMPPLPHVTDEQAGDILAVPRRRRAAAPACGHARVAPTPAGPVVAMAVARAPAARAGASEPCRLIPKDVAAPAERYFTDYGLGYPYLLAPPWSQIIAYDLNRGVIKWRKPLGQDLDVAKEGGKGPACRAARSARA